MEKIRSQSLILTPAEVKIRRLKMLQTIESRRLELINRQLSRAESKALHQLDLQRMEFRRRLSDVTGQLGSEGMIDGSSNICATNKNTCSPSEHRALQCCRTTRSLSRIGNQTDRVVQPLRVSKTYGDSNDTYIQDTYSSSTEAVRPPFWIRTPSIGMSPDLSATELFSTSESGSPNIQTQSEPGSRQSLLQSPFAVDNNDFSAGQSRATEQFTFPPAEYRGEIYSSKTLDMRPMWLKALYKLREQRYARLHGQQAEECEQLAALVTGCNLTSSFTTSLKKRGAKTGTVTR